MPDKVSWSAPFGLIAVEELDTPVPLKPCKVCGGTDIHFTMNRLLWRKLYLVWCCVCELGSDPQDDPIAACDVWNLNYPEKAILEKRIPQEVSSDGQ